MLHIHPHLCIRRHSSLNSDFWIYHMHAHASCTHTTRARARAHTHTRYTHMHVGSTCKRRSTISRLICERTSSSASLFAVSSMPQKLLCRCWLPSVPSVPREKKKPSPPFSFTTPVFCLDAGLTHNLKSADCKALFSGCQHARARTHTHTHRQTPKPHARTRTITHTRTHTPTHSHRHISKGLMARCTTLSPASKLF